VHAEFAAPFEAAIRQRLFLLVRKHWSCTSFCGSGSLPQWGRAMTLARHNVRLPVALDKALRALAKRHDVTVYAMLQRAVSSGVATLANPSATDTATHEIVTELALVSTRIVDIERMLDRALFTACAAYCYARSAAQGTRKSDDIITNEIKAAYDRQRRLSQEDQS
jgi:hypothetical protein